MSSLCLVGVLFSGCGGKETPPPAPPPSAEREQQAVSPELLKLKGRWARADGDYMLEIANVDASGKLEAKYYNPGPINVAKAMGFRESDGMKVFVELRDEGYPGCTYSLSFDASTDQLYGQYFQAAMQETYNVTFARLKEE